MAELANPRGQTSDGVNAEPDEGEDKGDKVSAVGVRVALGLERGKV